jgi:hypothetical protein
LFVLGVWVPEICFYSNPIVIKGGVCVPESSCMTSPPRPRPQASRRVKGKGNKKPNPVPQSSCVLPYPRYTSAFCIEAGGGGGPRPPSCPPPPGPPPAADGARAPAANLARRCQPQSWQTTDRREELLAGQADPPPSAIKPKTLCLSHSHDHLWLPLSDPVPGPQTPRILLLCSPHLPAPRHLPP